MMASGEEIVSDSGAGTRPNRRRWIYAGIGAAVIVLIVVVAVAVTQTGGGGSDGGAAPRAGNTVNEARAFRDLIQDSLSIESIPTGTAWDEANSYQSKALVWLTNDSNGKGHHDDRILQRYAVACFYFSTYSITTTYSPQGLPWRNSDSWLSEKHECQWFGVICDEHLKVVGFQMPKNEVSGALPMELALIKKHLNTLELEENKIFMTDAQLDVFGKLVNLKEINMIDNYVYTDTGIPQSLGLCSSLEKLQLSFNLLEGPISGSILNKWPNIELIELESNYLSGTVPAELGGMSQLVYLYMRNNILSGNLDFLKSGTMDNLFSLWLDDNDITGTIPTEIGLATELASISLSNSTLVGTIPTEFGLLTGLRRVWLFNNQLTGTLPVQLGDLSILEVFEIQNNNLNGAMPRPVCEAVSASTYEHSSLVADCAEVSCLNCCTECA